MSEFKLPLPRRLLRCDAPRHDDALVARDLEVFDEIAAIEPSRFEAPDLLLVVDALVDELSISLTLIPDEVESEVERKVAEVA